MISDLIDELVGMDPTALDQAVREFELERRRAEVRLAAAIAVVDERGAYRDGGHRSLVAYLKATLNCGGGEAARLKKRARTINDEPAVGAAHLAGHIGTAQVDRLARAAQHPRTRHRFGEFVPQLLDHAEHLPFPDFDVVVKRFELLADPDGAFDDQQFQEDERAATVSTVGSAVHVAAHGGSALQAAEMKAIFDQALEDEFRTDCAARRREFGDDAANHPLPRTAKQRSFDALYSIFVSYVTVPADGKRPEPLVNILVDGTTAGQTLHDHGLVDDPEVFGPAPTTTNLLDHRCETSNGVPIPPDAALAAMLTGHVRRVVLDSAGVIVDMGRARRLFTGKARDAAQLLTTTCQFPGCSVPAEFCDVDHLDEWAAHEGATDQANSGNLCGVHDRYKHRERLRARRSVDGRVRLIRPDGSVVKPAGERDPEWADGASAEHGNAESSPSHRPASSERDRLRALGWCCHHTRFSQLRHGGLPSRLDRPSG